MLLALNIERADAAAFEWANVARIGLWIYEPSQGGRVAGLEDKIRRTLRHSLGDGLRHEFLLKKKRLVKSSSDIIDDNFWRPRRPPGNASRLPTYDAALASPLAAILPRYKSAIPAPGAPSMARLHGNRAPFGPRTATEYWRTWP